MEEGIHIPYFYKSKAYVRNDSATIEAAELTVVEGNNRAIHMYESFGFIETGRIPKANKYDDGTYSDDIFMVKSLK